MKPEGTKKHKGQVDNVKTIVILADSLNRRHLSAYGCDWTITPNIERLQKKCVVFDNHWTGSAPCMPARRDILTGRLHFLERNWGPIEPFDHTLPHILRQKGIYSHMVTDHYHYLETGGENYCQMFNTWECFRGQERDPWVSRVKHNDVPEHYGRHSTQYDLNRSRFTRESDYPTPMTLSAAVDWMEENKDADNYLLFVEAFDPHEPFDVPEDYLKLYKDDYEGTMYYWPGYNPVDVPADALEHIRKRYAALLTMTDKWIGKMLDVMDKYNMWEDTLVIFTTDHGFMLGEHNYMGKNYMPAYNEIFHIPLMVHWPGKGSEGQRINALTQNIDILPTVLEYFNIDLAVCKNKLHGRSLRTLIDQDDDKIRDSVIYGYFGKTVNITDGEYTYFRTFANYDNLPLNIYTAMPTTMNQYLGIDSISDMSKIETGRFLKWTEFPVYRLPGEVTRINNQVLSYSTNKEYINKNLLFNIVNDYGQCNPINSRELENRYIGMLKKAMESHDSPEEQYLRLGI